eukprot:TRINITY_DN6261_c0_g1_i4.p1 TRINITY_DN6261_c0_g1~~TRINITY_DN6261_c0_g1_i4.p1  ORF type:complete len:421 (+),score=113.06 TRINITY_DN6261_c0_g1_i4:1106-2368(+)
MDFVKVCLRRFEEHIREELRSRPFMATTTVASLGSSKGSLSSMDEETEGTRGKGKKFNKKQRFENQKQQQGGKGKNRGGEEDLSLAVNKLAQSDEEMVALLHKWFSSRNQINQDTEHDKSRSAAGGRKQGKEEIYNERCLVERTKSFFELLFLFLKPTVLEIWTREEKIIMRSSSDLKKEKEQIKSFQAKFDVLYLNFLLFAQGIENVKDEWSRVSLGKYLTASLGEDLLNHILLGQAQQNLQTFTGDVTSETRKMIMEKIPRSLASLFHALEVSVNNKNLSGFLVALKNVTDKCEIHCRELDKKSTRTLMLNHREEALQALKTTSNPFIVFQYILVCLCTKALQFIIYVNPNNPEHLKILLSALEGEISPTISDSLNQCYLKVINKQEGDGGDEELSSLLSYCKQFTELPNLKKFGCEK